MMTKTSIEETLQDSLAQIERAKQEWEATVDTLSLLVCLLDHDGKILRANRTLDRWNLGRVTEVKGKTLHQLLHPDCADSACYLLTLWPQAWAKILQGQPVDHEVRDQHLDRYLRLQIQPVAEGADQHKMAADSLAVVLVQDITDLKQVQDALQQAHDELEQHVEMRTAELSQANASLRQEIAERRRVEEELKQRAAQLSLINDLGRQITAVLELNELLNQAAQLVQETFDYHHVALFLKENNRLRLKAVAGSYVSYFPPGHTQQINEGINGWVASSGQKIVANNVEQEPRYISLIAEYTVTQAELCLPIKIAGETVGVLDIQSPKFNAFSDNDVVAMEALANQIAVAIRNTRLYEAVQQELKERKRAETALAQERTLLAQRVAERTTELSIANAELERAARLKDEFLANMSHELRTPLNTVLGMAEVLRENVYGQINEEQQQVVDYIQESGRHLLELINDILDLAKIEAGKTDLLVAPVAVAEVCQASLLFIKQTAHQKQISVSTSFDDKVDIIQADERRLKQILVNLLSNAVKFAPKGGQIGLEVEGDQAQGVVHFRVWDTGIGIRQKDILHLFEPFVQVDSSLSRQHEGTGLGLSLVYRLTEMHGGSVTVESKVEEGSRFTVSLPWEPVDEKDTSHIDLKGGTEKTGSHADTAASLSAPTILLADDNEANITTFSGYLEARGYRVVIARNGAEALAQTKEENPDIILMDIQMPTMDGLEATRRLRAAPELPAIPIIALTALAMPGDRERCLQAGANEHLSKPVSLKRLEKLIESHLDHSLPQAEGVGSKE